MMGKLAAASMRHRLGSFAGTFLTAFLAIALIAGSGLLLWSVLTAGPDGDRFAAADAVVAGDRSVVLTTATDKGDKVKVKTKEERLSGAQPLPAELAGRVAATPGVAEAVADYAFPVALDADGKPLRAPDAATVAHGWSSAALTPYPLREGAAPRRGEVVLQGSFGAHVGQAVRMTSRTGTAELRVAGVADGNVPGQAAVFVADEQVAQLSGLPGPTAVAVRLEPGAEGGDVLTALRNGIGATATVHTGADRPAADLPGAVPDYIGAVSVFGFVLGITGFAAVFVLTGTVSLAVRQRLRELALLRAAGATPRQLRRMLRLEITLVTLAAAVPGLPAGIVAAHLIAARFRDLDAVPPQFTVSLNAVVLIAAVVLGLGVTVLATAIAARRAVRIAPTQAMRETVTAGRVGVLPRIVLAAILVGGAVAVLGLVPLGGPFGMGMGFISCSLLLCAVAALGPVLVGALTAVVARLVGLTGVVGRVASAVARADSRRVAGVAIPLTLVFAINGTMLVNGDILTAVTADQQAARTAPATVRVAAASGIPLGTAEQVAALAGVTGSAATLPTRVVVDESGKPEDYAAQGLRASGEPAVNLGVTDGDLAGVRPGTVAVSGPLAAARSWHLGDRPVFWLADGTRTELTVVAIYRNWRGFGDVVLPADLIATHDPRGVVGALYLRGAPDVAETVAHRWPALVATDAADPRGGPADVQNQQAAWELMVVISLGFTAIAVLNTFAVATGARRREFADLRLAGATPRQLHRMLGREALITVAVALVLGCVISGAVVGTFSIAQDGRWRLFAEPLRYLTLLGGVGLLGMVAGMVPARVVIRRRSLPAVTGRADG
ncbi:ABC transporter permease [Amycolatopsis thermophila]|uniref:ABC transport system permease protein n=1 Tax=Amycolatopsis thermophila TaxID=206084 RepID=A0ABU0EVD3_9PSEU|nr:ABC transporter permease [Amycolatopsis thermophila]MDQ0378921.1 putative ABC transport system permease protein [Amycolatopsis thermophila]